LCFMFLTLYKASAQSPQTSQSGSSQTPTLRALAVGFEDGLRVLEILDSNLKSTGQLRLNLRSYSAEFTCPIIDGKVIFGIENGKNAEGQTIYKPVGTVAWNPDFKKVCLVFIPKSFTGGSDTARAVYDIKAMDMSERDFALGSTKVVNLSPVKAYLRLGEHKKVIERGESIVIPKVEEVSDANMTQLNVYYLADGAPQNVMQTRIRYLKRIRYVIVLYPDFENKRLGVSSILDSGNLF
jgi:hypothetical protein